MIKRGIRARVRPALDLPGGSGFRRVFPFRRAWVVIGILAVIDAIFIFPAVTVFSQAVSGWSNFEDLFDLVAAVFSSAWLLGWSIAPLIMTVALLVMLFGRETVTIRGDTLRVFIGLPLFGFAGDYRIAGMRNLRVETPQGKSGKSWRGAHLVFDYGANEAAFGSNADHNDLALVSGAVQRESRLTIRSGEATAQELEGVWEAAEKNSAHTLVSEPALTASEKGAVNPVKWSSPTSLALILANLVPVAGTVFLGWNLGDVMVLYWAESAVIGFYNVCKLAVIGRWMALFTGTFFVAHFGAFMAVHFLFIYGIFVEGFQSSLAGDLDQVGQLFVRLWPALAALFVSHGVSFFANFIGHKEYKGRSLGKQMGEPYSRIVLMHLVIIFGGGLAMILGSTTPVLLVVIAAKILFDVRAHLKEHARNVAPVDRGVGLPDRLNH